jgi:glyoxylase-like metal-dependent hydrolase (beta-lactamase superfamily II)
MTKPNIHAFFDEPTNTVSYLVACQETREAAVIDPVLDYDHKSGKGSSQSADRLLQKAEDENYRISWVLETHVHADHLSGAPYIQLKTGAKVGIGERVRDVQKIFRPIFNAVDVSGDGSEFDHLFKDGETIHIGKLKIDVIATPGHTPACVSYKIEDAIFVGDTIFMPDYGTARADFPGGSAESLFRSARKLLTYPPETRLFMCHDYKAPGRDHYAWETTVAEERNNNPHVHDGMTEQDFVALREARDAQLAAPTLLLPSIQVNMRAGNLPPADSNGVRYLKVPVKLESKFNSSPARIN